MVYLTTNVGETETVRAEAVPLFLRRDLRELDERDGAFKTGLDVLDHFGELVKDRARGIYANEPRQLGVVYGMHVHS